ncbi:MAG: inorganic phosphate transporter [Tidjanibacter sp.]|nr:inorganic phosphate transporter [Tidjanibacter sp.]
MNSAYFFIVVFLFVLAIVDLVVGVSNDAVNFLSSAVGSKAASIKKILVIAAIGIFLGAATSNGMMEIARHGMFHPEHFYFNELMCIFLAVVVSDVIILDIFNSLGMPTSTTVSMVFELLGASFIIALIKLGNDSSLDLAQLLNTEKALTVIIGIFLSVAIAFVVGSIIQWLSRLIFTFNYKKKLGGKIGIFGGIAATSILYFMLIKGMKEAAFMTEEVSAWMDQNVGMIVLASFIFFTVLMQILHWCKVNVFKVVVLMGTFALAMAFAGNDLVNFIGVTLAGADSYKDFITNGAGLAPNEFLMGSLNEPATSSTIYLLIAGAVMVVSLMTSKKAHRVLQTSIDLSRQDAGNEMFGTSSVARSIVRVSSTMAENTLKIIPDGVKTWANNRFVKPAEADREDSGAAFDLVRASVNLVVAGLLIALGTSLKLPLSTTYVTFMVGMGTSLADRAWGRESAVYRVTGVISVIGGWFITAGVAFLVSALIVAIMYYGGMVAMIAMIFVAAFILIRSHINYKKKQQKTEADEQLELILSSTDQNEVWDNLKLHTADTLNHTIVFAADTYKRMFEAFSNENLKILRLSLIKIIQEKAQMKQMRRMETKGIQRINKGLAYEKNTWYHLSSNSCQQILNTLNRICDPMKEHTDNNFTPLSKEYIDEFSPYCRELTSVFEDIGKMIHKGDFSNAERVSQDAKMLKKRLSDLRKVQTERLQEEYDEGLKVAFVYLNLIQESRELLSEVRNVLRGCQKFFEEN